MGKFGIIDHDVSGACQSASNSLIFFKKTMNYSLLCEWAVVFLTM